MTSATPVKAASVFNINLAIKAVIILFMVLGISKLLGQPGVIAGFAALLTALVDRPGSLRQRTFGLTVFVVLGYLPIAIASALGPNSSALLVLLFAISFGGSCMAGYGARMAHVGWVLTIWTTLALGFKVWDSIGVNFIGYVSGSLLMMVAVLVPTILHGRDLAAEDDHLPLIPPRDEPIGALMLYALIRAIGITIGAFWGQQFLQFNAYWVALTIVLILPPALQIHWDRGLQRAVGTVLGALAGYGLVLFRGDNDWLLLGFELVAAFLLLYTVKKKPYGLFVFFLSVFIVAQLGRLQDTDVALAGGTERIMATLLGVAIAIITSIILVPVVRQFRTDAS